MSDNLVEVNSLDDMITVLDSYHNVVVDFQALAWCQPCIRFQPVFVEAAEKNPDVLFVEVDIDTNPWAMEHFGVRSVPTIKLFHDQEFVKDLKPAPLAKFSADLHS